MSDPSIDAYYAIAMQIRCDSLIAAKTQEDARLMVADALKRTDEAIRGAVLFHGPNIKLVVLPEYFMTGHPFGETLAEWRDKASIDMDGAEYDAIGEIAQKHGTYIAGNAYEKDPHFPDFYFQASFVVAPNGDLVLRYRRLISMYSPSPYDVLDKYLDIYGADALFPVAETEIGRLGAVASEEILYPEIARCVAARGAEVLVHSSSEAGSNQVTIKNVAKQARAIENLAYVVSANSAGITGSPVLEGSTDFGSKVVDYRGNVLSEAGYGESINAYAEIDLAALRRYRRKPGMGNLLARQPLQVYAETYAKQEVHRPNGLLEKGDVVIPDRSYFVKRQKDVIEKLAKTGVI
ncbi:MAG: nitrilase-related carbon-nitrogen hydrolase [Pseudomonadota bacterium]